MPSFCGVLDCGSRADRDHKSFFRIPGIPKKGSEEMIKLVTERRIRWVNALKREDLTENKLKYIRICGDHFLTGKPSELNDREHPDWVPSQKMGYRSAEKFDLERFYRRKKRRMDQESGALIQSEALTLESTSENEDSEDTLSCASMDLETTWAASISCASTDLETTCASISVQTDLKMADIDIINNVCQDLQTQLTEAKNALESLKLDESSMMNNDKKVKYYTGIPNFVTLSIIFNLIQPYLTVTHMSSLSKFQKFLLTMMHLRLNLDFTDLGYRFGISNSTASRTFTECLRVLQERLCNLVSWPEREALMNNDTRKVTVMIDCFECKIEKPSNSIAAAQYYSNDKHHHTIKYLIGISPQGCIIFVSSAWEGQTSDEHVLQNSGFLEKLLPGDLVLADGGFNVEDDLYCAELKIHAFTKGKKQLDAVDVETARKLARVRIHVKRIIGQLRQKFRILADVMPVTMIKKTANNRSIMDDIVKVCCALINFMPSVIPAE